MGSTKAQRRRISARAPQTATEGTQFDSRFIFQALLSAVQSPQGINSSVLKRLYLLLTHLNSNPQFSSSSGVGLNCLDLESGDGYIRVAVEEICRISDVIFKELSERLEKLFCYLCNGDDNSHLDMCDGARILHLLLRCCLLMLTLLQHHQNLFLEKSQVIFGILKKLKSVNFVSKKKEGISFKKSVACACGNVDDGYTASSTEDFVASLHFLEPSDPRIHFMSGILEVILDELLVHGQLRSSLMLVDSVAPACEMLYTSHCGQGDNGILMEVISAHFSLAFSSKQAIEEFLSRLFLIQTNKFNYSFRNLDISPSAVTLLLLNPVILSAPKFILAHLISLVSDGTSNVLDHENWKPNCRLMNCFLSVFEKSVILYAKHMHNSQLNSHCTSAKNSVRLIVYDEDFLPSFESLILPDTRKRINRLITDLDDCSESHFRSKANQSKSDLVSSAIRYVKECQHVFDKSCQDEILSILSCIILRASDSFKGVPSDAVSVGCLQDLCILGSVLKLMSTSLLQVISCLRYNDDLNCPKSLHDVSPCMEYNFVSSIISRFGEFDFHLPIQQVLSNMMQNSSTRHKNSRMMFLHFAGLLCLSFTTGLDFLVKGCLLAITALMNLFVFEEGNLDAFAMLLDCSSESFSSELPLVNIQETAMDQKDQKVSLVVATKFRRTRTLYSSTSSLVNQSTGLGNGVPQVSREAPILDNMDSAECVEEETEETTNGEIFLKCVLKDGKKISDFDDLADFIECKKGKDYSTWLRHREKYRKWKGEKMAVFRWRRKKETWKFAEGKKL